MLLGMKESYKKEESESILAPSLRNNMHENREISGASRSQQDRDRCQTDSLCHSPRLALERLAKT